MKINTENWAYFKVSEILDTIKCKKYSSIPDSPGQTPFISSTAVNNGIATFCDEVPTITSNCITVSTNGECFSAFYHKEPLCISTDVEAFTSTHLNERTACFLCTILEMEKPKWCYGRKPKSNKVGLTMIKLPAIKNEDGTFSPDWEFMERFISERNNKKITTKIKSTNVPLKTEDWKEFYLYKLFDTQMGSGIDAVLTTSYNPKYNYVSRDSNGNGVVAVVDEMEGKTLFKAGTMTLALGGSFLGSCFVQYKDFYTAQNVGILKEKEKLSIYAKLFISTLIRNECKIKYQAFGRELNSHFRKDFTLKLPVKMIDGKPLLDESKKYSDKGYIPDWEFMEKYIKSLPYSDRI